MKNPKISIITPTYVRVDLLFNRCVNSILNQTYRDWELLMVGDGSPENVFEDIAERLDKIRDDRITFTNIHRSNYPSNPLQRWQVLSVPPTNYGIGLTQGDWITFLDEDDEYYPNRLERMMFYTDDYDFIYHQVEMERARGGKRVIDVVGSYPPRRAHITRMAMMYHKKFKDIKLNMDSWKENEVSDWNQIKRIVPKAKVKFIPEVLGKHYMEKRQWNIK